MSGCGYVIEELMNGNLFVLNELDQYEIGSLIGEIRSSLYKDDILDAILPLFKERCPLYAFLLAYDSEREKDFCRKFLEKDINLFKNDEFFHNFLGSSPWTVNYVREKWFDLVKLNKDNLFYIIRYGLYHNMNDLVREMAFCDDLEIRALFMKELVVNFPYYLGYVYDDITKYFVSNGKLMGESDVSWIAIFILENNLGVELFKKVKEFIFNNYDSNILASLLDVNNYDVLIIEDINRFFITSKNYKWNLYCKYRDYITDVDLSIYDDVIVKMASIDIEVIEAVFKSGLGDKLIELLNKYMKKCTGATVVGVGSGSCSTAYKIGDYVLKCSFRKWSYEDRIVPRSYLIAKVYDEYIARDEKGCINGALEVQDYYSKPVLENELSVVDCFSKSLDEAGYRCYDYFIGADGNSNLFYLDDYHDADCDNPEELPDWFKKSPVVLVDRDLVIEKNNKRPKVLGKIKSCNMKK